MQWLIFEIETPIEAQPKGVIQHAVGLQAIEYATRRGACWHINQPLFTDIQGLLQRSLLAPGTKAQRQAGKQHRTFKQ